MEILCKQNKTNSIQPFQYWFEKIALFLRWNGRTPSIVFIMLLNVMAYPIIWSIAFPGFDWLVRWDTEYVQIQTVTDFL